jgi:hypothetical protein
MIPSKASPWYLLAAGLAAVVLAVLALWAEPAPGLLGIRLGLLLSGLLAAGVAVANRPRSAPVLGLAALIGLTASFGFDSQWDTALLMLRVLSAVAAVAAVLVLLPRRAARFAVSVLIVVHFGGILTAVLSVPPPGGQAPWLANQLWTRFYRPYLQFMYLNNAYHFYSPEPGPATLLWFHIAYSDGSSRWISFPDRREHTSDPLALSYYRRLPLSEAINQQVLPLTEPPPELTQRRAQAGQLLGIPSPVEVALYLPGLPQFRVPTDTGRQMLQSFARHVYRAYAHADPQVTVAGVKVYRVVHTMLPPGRFAAGVSPLEPTLYLPYYQGEFDREGNLKHPDDPFLYWLIPILRVEPGEDTVLLGLAPFIDRRLPARGGGEIRDYVQIHAQSKR